MRVLLTGWFSFSNCEPTAGDHETRTLIEALLLEANIEFDVLLDLSEQNIKSFLSKFGKNYSHLIVACGPFSGVDAYQELLVKGLPRAIKIGINLSMTKPLNQHQQGFDYLLERDSLRTTRVDLSFGLAVERVPVVGLLLVEAQTEYGDHSRHCAVNPFILKWLYEQGVAVIPIDTRMPKNEGGLTTFAQIESVIAKMDLVVTTRLHGMVLALKNHVPAIAIDPVAGGAKISAQAHRLNWPALIKEEELTAESLDQAFQWCRSDSSSALARTCSDYGSLEAHSIGAALIDYITRTNP